MLYPFMEGFPVVLGQESTATLVKHDMSGYNADVHFCKMPEHSLYDGAWYSRD